MSSTVKRILLVTGELPFRGSSILLLRLAEGLQQQNCEVVVLCCRRGNLDQSLLRRVKVVEVPGLGIPLWGRVVRRSLRFHLVDNPPDILHVFGTRLLAPCAWLSRQLQRPLVLGLTGQNEARRISMPGSGSGLAAITCVSQSVQDAIPARYNQIEQRVILPGVPLQTDVQHPAVLPGDRVPVVGMAGPLEEVKGGRFFLRACHRVLESGRQIRIVVAGSGPEERNLRKLATSLELNPHVTFVDDGVAMHDYLSALDIFCLPSVQQGFGVILLEAMALGRPAIASGVGGILSIIQDGRNGLIVPPSDSSALAERIIELLDDPEKARRLAVAGQNLVEDRFTVERMAGEMLTLYEDITTNKAPAVAAIPIRPKRETVE